MSEQITYHRPDTNYEKEGIGFHSLLLEVDGEKVGSAELEYRSRPFPYYFLYSLDVDPAFQGKGYGSKVMAQVEAFLLGKGKAGVVADAIDIDSPATEMYGNRGWELIPGESSSYVFNPPKGAVTAELKGYYRRYNKNYKDQG